MKKILATDEYTIYQRRDSRHAIVGADKKYVNGADKIAILIEHKIPPFDELKIPAPIAAAEETDDSESGAEDKDVPEEQSTEEAEAEVEAKADDEQSKSKSVDAVEDADEKAAEEVEKSDESSSDSEEESDEDAKPADDK